MKHQNLLYAALFVLVVVLVGLTILLQISIVNSPLATVGNVADTPAANGQMPGNDKATTPKSFFDRVREQLAMLLMPVTAAPAASVNQPVAATATSTPMIIIVTPTPQAPAPSLSPTAPASAPEVAQAGTLRLAGVTPVKLVQTAPTSSTPLLSPTLTAPTPVVVDYAVGYLTERSYCPVLTEIAVLILEQIYDQRVRKVAFASSDELYQALAHLGDEQTSIDLTFCTIFPDDMAYLQQYDDKLVPFGGAYTQLAGQRWHVLGYAGTQLPMRQVKPCLYQFLTTGILTLALDEEQLTGTNALRWLIQASARVEEATQCE